MDKDLLFSRATKFTGEEELALLQDSTVLVAGVGGLGSILCETLVRRGIGKLIILDRKEIDLPDLNRQILYKASDLGKAKLEVAKERLQSIHPFTEVEFIDVDIADSKSLQTKLEGKHFQIIADCLDNFGSRYSLESILKERHFLVHGGVKNDFGQLTTIDQSRSLAKLYGDISDEEGPIAVCSEIVNIIGSLMANEVIACLKDKSKLLDKLLIVELSDFSQFKLDIDLRK